jgi:uncharacterized protein (DUF2235 family)
MIGAWDTVDALGFPLPGLRELTRPRVGRQAPLLGRCVENLFHALALDETRVAFAPTLWHVLDEHTGRVEQVWFPGAHGDVCGGFGNRGLADISLAWMVECAEQCGLAFDRERVERELKPDPAQPPTPVAGLLRWLHARRPRRLFETQTESIHASVFEKIRLSGGGYPAPEIAKLLQGIEPA